MCDQNIHDLLLDLRNEIEAAGTIMIPVAVATNMIDNKLKEMSK